MLFGYNTPVGFWGGEVAYRPNVLARVFQFSASVGLGIPEGFKLSGGINLFPFKDRRLTPFLGGSYTVAFGAWYPSKSNTESVRVGQNNYLNPFLGLKFNSRKGSGFLKLIIGYSFLQGSPNFTITPGTASSGINYNDYYSKRLNDDYFVGLGIGGTF